MKLKSTIFWVVVLVLYFISQKLVWQEQKYDYVNNYMFSYTTPKVRKFLAGGHEALVSNLSLIRGIQFYGMNYPLFDKKPAMYEQFGGLAEAAVQLDPRFSHAYDFWGFAFTSSRNGAIDSYRFLMAGAERMTATDEVIPPTPLGPAYKAVQPSSWRAAKAAGYVAQYELKNATPEWTLKAYETALMSPDCPDFVDRLRILVMGDLLPDPMVPIREMTAAANASKNDAIRELNLGHIRRLVSTEHKRFWDFAQQAYREIHGASPTSIAQITKDISVLKAAVGKYHKLSLDWSEDGQTQLFPNLLNPKPGPLEVIRVEVAHPPQLPIDPYGGEYVILDIMGEPQLLATGPILDERADYIYSVGRALEMYKKDHDGACPEDLDVIRDEMGITIAEADGLGYPPLFDSEECKLHYPPISEEDPPLFYPYGIEPGDVSDETLGLMPAGDETTPPEEIGDASPENQP